METRISTLGAYLMMTIVVGLIGDAWQRIVKRESPMSGWADPEEYRMFLRQSSELRSATAINLRKMQ